MRTAIITTTIYVPELLKKYVADAKRYNHDCFFIVIGDKKTPAAAKSFCNNLATEIYFFDVEAQTEYLVKFPELDEHLVYNSIQRRNIGVLMAYEKGADIIITIDDDNHLVDEDFIGLHKTGVLKNAAVMESDTGWLNVCDFLKEEYNRRFYHRGFPQEKKFLEEKISSNTKDVKVVVNAGFWLEDPDIDALTRLYFPNQPINTLEYKRENNFILAKNTWSPFNSQNTALAREIIPAYFLSPYIGRYDDIWASYIIKRIADHLDHGIAFGMPIVQQKRNPHNYWKDMEEESMGMILTTRFTNILRNIELDANNYSDCYQELAQKLSIVISEQDWAENEKKYLENYLSGMRVWIKTFARLNEKGA